MKITFIISAKRIFTLSLYVDRVLTTSIYFNTLTEAMEAKDAWKGFINDHN